MLYKDKIVIINYIFITLITLIACLSPKITIIKFIIREITINLKIFLQRELKQATKNLIFWAEYQDFQ